MTEAEAKHALIKKAYEEVGYHEQGNNWTKYAADPQITQLYGWNVQNQPWCNTFVNWLFIAVFGYAKGTEMTYGGSARCFTHAQLYKNNNAWYTEPEKGDQIFYGGEGHTGVVVDVSGATITTVEGNWTDSVVTRTHFFGDSEIIGYGRPKWSAVADEPEPETDEEGETDIIHPMHRRACYHLEYPDGCTDKGYTPQASIKAWQNLLLCWGMDLGKWGADGEYGDTTKKATEEWQAKAKALGADVEINGVVDTDDWESAIYVPVE